MREKLFTRNFSLLIAGLAVSLFGNCILDFALSMYVLERTGSAAVFAGFLAAAMLPTILLSPLGGVLADRVNRRNIMVALDVLSGLAILASALFLTRGNDLLVIAATLVVMSVLGAFESPTAQACVPQMQRGSNLVRGNAVVNQVSALSALTGPFAGSMLYTAFGLRTVMYAGAACFFATALFECFIRLPRLPARPEGSFFVTLRSDLTVSFRYICRERTAILKLLLLVALVAFFIQGTALVGLPYMVRNTLGLSANYYGAVESVLGLAGLAGSVAAGFLIARFRTSQLSLLILGLGLCLFPVGASFLLPTGVFLRYGTLLCFFVIIQVIASIFSIFGLSIIQQLTPESMLGKIMAYTSTITLCAQPVSQIMYGIAFDAFSHAVFLVIVPTGVVLCGVGLCARRFFRRLETQETRMLDARTHGS